MSEEKAGYEVSGSTTENEQVRQIANELAGRFGEIDLPLAATSDFAVGYNGSAMAAQLTGGILAEVAKFLSDNVGLLPEKEAVIEAVNSGIDMLLSASGRPVLTRLIGPAVKQMIATAVSAMYDAILNPPAPRTEV